MKKVAMFVFNGEPMCFVHVLLNALDMKDKGYEVKIILEGASVKLVPELIKEGSPLKGLWQKCLQADLVEGVCKACSAKLGTLAATQDQKLTLLDAMFGHPSIAAYRDNGFEILTF
ncbi:MAG: cytoplasmic protein [Desulfuromonadaceae bacterium]|nr:cytoplasmic protein [Desulfuromonas sp.]MDY0185674.1 cytoplasmic protein [Desulfuromonadaceae bacterium]